MNSQYLGYYTASTHTITIVFNERSQLKLLAKEINDSIASYGSDPNDTLLLLKDKHLLYSYIGLLDDPSILVHELGHAWRAEEHIGSLHKPVDLMINGKIGNYSFNESCNIVFEQIIQKGFFGKLFAIFL